MMILQNIFLTLAISLALVCHLTRADSSGDILRKLEDGSISPETAMKKLLKQLKSSNDGQAGGLDNAALLEASKISEKSCTHEQLLNHHVKLAKLVYNLADSGAVIRTLGATWTRQLDLCLEVLRKQLDKQFLGKLDERSRNNLELYDQMVSSFEAKRASLGAVDQSDLQDMAVGKYVSERRNEMVKKLNKYGKVVGKVGKMVRMNYGQIRSELRGSCAAAAQVLGPINELVKLAQTDSKGAHDIGSKLELWNRVFERCVQFNKRLSTLDPIELDNFEQLDGLDESGETDDISS